MRLLGFWLLAHAGILPHWTDISRVAVKSLKWALIFVRELHSWVVTGPVKGHVKDEGGFSAMSSQENTEQLAAVLCVCRTLESAHRSPVEADRERGRQERLACTHTLLCDETLQKPHTVWYYLNRHFIKPKGVLEGQMHKRRSGFVELSSWFREDLHLTELYPSMNMVKVELMDWHFWEYTQLW